MNTKQEHHKVTLCRRYWKAAIAVVAMLVAPHVGGADQGEKKAVPLKVVILAGQSNMQQPAKWHTLAGLADSPETRPVYDKLVDKNGKVRIHKDVRIAMPQYSRDEDGNTITTPVPGPLPHGFGGLVLGKDTESHGYGPELGFGVTLHETLQEPILIIKAAWGGKSLNYHFRPPIGKEWTPPKGHPEHPDSAPPALPIPTSITLPDDFQPPEERGKNMQIMSGRSIGKLNGVYPIYIYGGYEKKGNLTSIPFETGDLIIGLNGEGLGENPVQRWRDLWFNEVRDGDWMIRIARWRPSTKLGKAGTNKQKRGDGATFLRSRKSNRNVA